MNSWSRAEGPTGVGSRDTTLLIAAHTTGDTSQSAPQNLSVTRTVSSSAFGYSQLTTGGDPMQREVQSDFRGTFGLLMDVCHLKHSERAKHLQTHRGRVVLWETTSRTDSGYIAVHARSTEHQLRKWQRQDSWMQFQGSQARWREMPTTQCRACTQGANA